MLLDDATEAIARKTRELSPPARRFATALLLFALTTLHRGARTRQTPSQHLDGLRFSALTHCRTSPDRARHSTTSVRPPPIPHHCKVCSGLSQHVQKMEIHATKSIFSVTNGMHGE